ncbi:MAG: cytochrome c [Gemmatimonadetes bacterium]|nr:cytochrome c [Gemmatimonadota bacterium]
MIRSLFRHASMTAFALCLLVSGCAGEPSESGRSRLAVQGDEEPASAERGAEHYASHCARCHGADGAGTVVYERSIQKAKGFTDLVQKGHGGLAALPIFTDNLLESIEMHLAVVESAPELAVPEKARKLYERHCIACHGPQGLGGSLAPITITGHPAIASIVRNGEGAMPPIPASTLSDADLDLIQRYLLSIR